MSDTQNGLLARVQALENAAKHSRIPIIDPTANVKELVEMQRRHASEIRLADNKRLDDLRTQDEKFHTQIDSERKRSDAEAKIAESERINALLLANKNDVALALSKQQAQAEMQDKRIAIVEQNQYQGVGRQGQQTEGRQQYQWVIGVALVVLALVINHLWK